MLTTDFDGPHASATLNGTELTMSFSESGEGVDTLVVTAALGGSSEQIKLRVEVASGPNRLSSLATDPASSPKAPDGAMMFQFDHQYGQPVLIHFSPSGQMHTVNNMVVLPMGEYHLIGYTNAKGCHSTEPVPLRVIIPCMRCEHD